MLADLGGVIIARSKANLMSLTNMKRQTTGN